MAVPLEKVFKKNLLRRLRDRGGFYYSTEMRGLSGIPDICGVRNGMFIGIECKRTAKSKITQLQAFTLVRIKENGGFGEVAHPDNVDELLITLERFVANKGY